VLHAENLLLLQCSFTIFVVIHHYPYSLLVATNRMRALDAAVELLGTTGIRALTHARVDERAGLPKGSTSNFFRTRRALVQGVADRIAELERPELDTTVAAPASVDDFVDGMCAFLDHVTTVNRVQTTARLALLLEASHDPDVRDTLARIRAPMVSAMVVTMATLGARNPLMAAWTVVACSEGLLLHRIARSNPPDPRPILRLVTEAALRD
jgi:DNA-binding transcriptional regulator YbjK